MASLILFMLMTTNKALALLSEIVAEEESSNVDDFMNMEVEPPAVDVNISQIVLIHFRLWNSLPILNEDLGFYMKPKSTIWFSRPRSRLGLAFLNDQVGFVFSQKFFGPAYSPEKHQLLLSNVCSGAGSLCTIQIKSWK